MNTLSLSRVGMEAGRETRGVDASHSPVREQLTINAPPDLLTPDLYPKVCQAKVYLPKACLPTVYLSMVCLPKVCLPKVWLPMVCLPKVYLPEVVLFNFNETSWTSCYSYMQLSLFPPQQFGVFVGGVFIPNIVTSDASGVTSAEEELTPTKSSLQKGEKRFKRG